MIRKNYFLNFRAAIVDPFGDTFQPQQVYLLTVRII